MKRSTREIRTPSTTALLFCGNPGSHRTKPSDSVIKKRAESWIADASAFMLAGAGVPSFLAPPATPPEVADAAAAYTCPGFPYGYAGNDFDLQI